MLSFVGFLGLRGVPVLDGVWGLDCNPVLFHLGSFLLRLCPFYTDSRYLFVMLELSIVFTMLVIIQKVWIIIKQSL